MCIPAKHFCQEKILLAGVTGVMVRQFSVGEYEGMERSCGLKILKKKIHYRDNGLAPCGPQQRLVISDYL